MTVLPLLLVASLHLQVKATIETRPVPDSGHSKSAVDTTKKRARPVSVGMQIGGGRGDDDDRPAPRRIPVTEEMRRTAFKDTTARDLLLRARVARLQQDSLLLSYEARAYQRYSIGMGLRAFARDRIVMRHEDVSVVRWHRARGAWVDVKGARTAISAAPREEAPENADMASDPPIPYVPGGEQLWIGGSLAKTEVDERQLVHPIAEGSEAYYTYDVGDSVTMTLPDQRVITLREIRVAARAPQWNLMVGSFWFDQSSAHLVRAVYRLSVPLDVWGMQKARGEKNAVPFWVKPMISPLKVDVDAISLEYGLYNGRFWMPKLQTVEASAQVGMVRVPVQVEQQFRYASVNGLDSLPPFPRPAVRYAAVRDSLRRAGVDSTRRDSLLREFRRQRDSTAKVLREQECARGPTYTRMRSQYNGALQMAVQMPCDTTALATSPELVGTLLGDGESVFATGDMADLKHALSFNLQAAWMPQPPTVSWGLGHTRFNRVEGFSTGAQVSMALGRGYTALVGLRASAADRQLNGDVGLERSNSRSTVRTTVYRRLAVASDFGNPLSFGAGLAALLYAGDEGFYYRSWGAELSGTTPRLGRTEWRLFAEQQWNALVRTHFTLFRGPHDDRVLPNVMAEDAIEFGGALRTQKGWGLDPRGLRVRADVRGEAATGDFDYTRGLLDLTISHGMPFGTEAAVTVSVGGIGGTAPAQRAFQLGGLHTVRGIRPGTMSGSAFWMGRGEVALSRTLVKPVLFGDVGWAGDRRNFSVPGRPMSGVGVGASIFDGMLRLDVARGLYPQKAVRIDLSLEARF